MAISIAHFGSDVIVIGGHDGDVIVRLQRQYVRLAADGSATVLQGAPITASSDLTPFTLSTFGAARRLAWESGAMALKPNARVEVWSQRYAAVIDRGAITVIDATRRGHCRLEVPSIIAPGTGIVAHGGRLAIATDQKVVMIPLEVLESLEARPGSEVSLDVTRVDPLRNPDASEPGRVAWVVTNGDALVNIGTRQLRLYGVLGLEQGMDVILSDELWPGTFASIAVPGRPLQWIHAPEPPKTIAARLVRGRTKDPAATSEPLAPAERQPEIDHLLAEIARDPDADAHRAVLVDLLQDLGASYGTWLAQERGGDPAAASPAKRRAALGPLAHYLEAVSYRGGLPWTASLVRRPPTDPEVVAAAAADVRLGMLSALRLGKGPIAIYDRLVGSPRAIGLRAVDAPERSTLAALIEGGHDQLTHLYDVRFSKQAAVTLLADPTFDRAHDLETSVQLAHFGSLLDRIVADPAGVFRRTPRALVIRERFHNDFGLLESGLARWHALPIIALTLGFVTLRRDDGVTSARLAVTSLHYSIWIPWLASALPAVASIELDDRNPALATAIRHALPATEIR